MRKAFCRRSSTMNLRRTPKRFASNAAATLAALALTFGYLIPQPCRCLGSEMSAAPTACSGDAGASHCCQTHSCCATAGELAADASLNCNGCTCDAAPEPTVAVPVVHSHDDGAAPAALVGQLAAMIPVQSPGVMLTDAARTGAPPDLRLHAFYSVWLN